jgi:hypothetical protein
MAILKAIVTFPTEQMVEVVKRLQENIPKFPNPDHVTIRGPYWKSTSEGMNWFTIHEVEPSKMYEERLRIGAFASFFNGVPGLKWRIEYWTEQSDTQKRIELYGA